MMSASDFMVISSPLKRGRRGICFRGEAADEGDTVKFQALGPLHIDRDGADVTPPGRVQRLVLAMLLVHANRAVPTGSFIDAVWPDEPITSAQARLPLTVHRIRTRLDDPARLSFAPGGYVLHVADDESDVAAFDRLTTCLRGGRMPAEEVVRITSEALGLWRGEPLEDVVELGDAAEVQRWVDRRRWVVQTWCEAQLQRGCHAEVIDRATADLAREPLHEPFAALLMRALRAAGRPADALIVYERTRVALRDELGLDPGPALREAQAQAFGDGPSAIAFAAPAQLPADVPLVARDDLVDTIGSPASSVPRAITGMAGVGKTALALAWGHRHRAAFPDGQLFLDLRGYSHDEPIAAEDALASLLASLGFAADRIPAGVDARAALWRSLTAARRMLVLLDNARGTDQVRPLLVGGGNSTVIVTSRNALPGLAAREGAQVIPVSPLAPAEAVSLLRELIGPDADDDPAALKELARVCGGLPLALRIAAQRLAGHEGQCPATLLADLCDEHDHLDLLDADDGVGTDFRAGLSWSYGALSPEAARVFRMLGLLSGIDIDLVGLAAFCGLSKRETRRHADALLRLHLVQRTDAGLYTQDDLLRAYAAERAAEHNDADSSAAAKSRLLSFYVAGQAGARADIAWGARGRPLL